MLLPIAIVALTALACLAIRTAPLAGATASTGVPEEAVA